MRKPARLLLLGLIAASTGCAPALGPGPRIVASPSGLMMTPSCFMYGDALMTMSMGAGPRFWGRRVEVRALQSRMSAASSDVRAQMGSWKEAARGC